MIKDLLLITFGASLSALILHTYQKIHKRNILRRLQSSEESLDLSSQESLQSLPQEQQQKTEKDGDLEIKGDNKKNVNMEKEEEEEEQIILHEQLSRTSLFYTPHQTHHLKNHLIVIIGLGGVGSHCAVSLYRSGCFNLRLVDFDQITLSSLNRHCCATRGDVGQSKVGVLRNYLLEIYPYGKIDTRNIMFTLQNAPSILYGASYVIDCIDHLPSKLDLITLCKQNNIPVISSMGSACKSDPSRVQIGDVWETVGDSLSRAVRYGLKKRGVGGGVTVVFSSEVARVGIQPPTATISTALSTTTTNTTAGDTTREVSSTTELKDYAILPSFRVGILPVIAPLPAIFGNALASYVLAELCHHPLTPLTMKPTRHGYYSKLLKELQKRYSDDIVVGVDVSDIGILVDDIYKGKCLLTNSKNELSLIKWRRERGLVMDNLILLSKQEVEKFSGMTFEEVVGTYGREFVEGVERKLERVRELLELGE